MRFDIGQIRTEVIRGERSFVRDMAQAAASVDVTQIFDNARATARDLVAVSKREDRDRFLLSGSGDSLFAAVSAAPAMRQWSGLDFRALTSIECARYELPHTADQAVMIAVSNSGGSTRTRETAALARKLHVPSFGVVGKADGPLAKSADTILHRPVALNGEPPAWSPRVFLNAAEYMAGLTALYALGLHAAREAGTMTDSEVADWRERIAVVIANIGNTAEAAEPLMRGLAMSMDGARTIWVLGAGPSRGSADYSAAKFHEQVPINGVAQDLEEWAHLQYFLTLDWGRAAIVLVLAPKGHSADRAGEMLKGIRQAGGRAVLLTDDPSLLAHNDAEAVVEMPGVSDELLSPLTFHVPAQLLALQLAWRRKVPEIPLRRTDDYWLIRGGGMQAGL
ncbi:MAG: SIS domain-containing protein [Roseibium sp.]|nr:SIS domain-containing protein [Roseibium sp.]